MSIFILFKHFISLYYDKLASELNAIFSFVAKRNNIYKLSENFKSDDKYPENTFFVFRTSHKIES